MSQFAAFRVRPAKFTVWPEVSTSPVASIAPLAVTVPSEAISSTLPSLLETPVASMIPPVFPASA